MSNSNFKVGQWVRCINEKSTVFKLVGKITAISSSGGIIAVNFGRVLGNCILLSTDLIDEDLDPVSLNSLILENNNLREELEKYKPKPRSKTVTLYLYQGHLDKNTIIVMLNKASSYVEYPLLATKEVTITEGEGM